MVNKKKKTTASMCMHYMSISEELSDTLMYLLARLDVLPAKRQTQFTLNQYFDDG